MHVCDMVNIEWGVDDEEIYQVPDVALRHNLDNASGGGRSRPVSTFNPQITSPSHSAMKRTKSISPESYVLHMLFFYKDNLIIICLLLCMQGCIHSEYLFCCHTTDASTHATHMHTRTRAHTHTQTHTHKHTHTNTHTQTHTQGKILLLESL